MSIDHFNSLARRMEHIAQQARVLGSELKQVESEEYDKLTLPQQCIAYQRMQEQYKRLDDARKSVYHVLDKISKVTLPEAMESAGVPSIAIEELGKTIYMQTRFSATIKDKELAMKWLREGGYDDLITETVSSSSLTALCKELELEQGISPPEDAINFRSFNQIGAVKSGSKKTTKSK